MMNKRGVTFSKGKAKNRRGTILNLLHFLKLYTFLFILAFILNVLSIGMQLMGPYIIGQILNEISNGIGSIDMNYIYQKSLILMLLYLVSTILQIVLTLLMTIISKKAVRDMRNKSYQKLLRLNIAYFDTHKSGDILSVLSYDIDTVNTSLSNDLIQIVTSIITIVFSFVMMCIISRLLILVFVITIPVSFIFTKVLVKKTKGYFKKKSIKLGELNGFAEEMITSLPTIKAYAKEEEAIKQFDKLNIEAAEASYKAEYYSAYIGPGMNFVNNLTLSVICLYGAILETFNLILFGDISSFVLYSKKFAGPVNEIANIVTDIESALASAERVFTLLDEKEEKMDGDQDVNSKESKGVIEFKNVYFGYNQDNMILKNVSFETKPHETIAIVGETGAGKSTIMSLLMRFYEVNSGAILLDGVNIALLDKVDLRKQFSLVLQDTWLFKGTIYENLTYGSPNATIEDVKKACHDAYIDNFIESLKDGYNTMIYENGSNISVGEKQLLTIARAMLLKANILILDEATSNVDVVTEINIRKSMAKLMENKTSFVIAHRLSTIINADKIIVLKDGMIVEMGTHKSLIDAKGYYAELYNSKISN